MEWIEVELGLGVIFEAKSTKDLSALMDSYKQLISYSFALAHCDTKHCPAKEFLLISMNPRCISISEFSPNKLFTSVDFASYLTSNEGVNILLLKLIFYKIEIFLEKHGVKAPIT